MRVSFLAAAVLAMTLAAAASIVAQEQEDPVKKEVNQKFGFSFEHRTLQRTPIQPDVTLLDAYIDAQPGSFLEVEWLRPRDHAEYVKNLSLGMKLLDLVPEKETEASLGGRKFAHVAFNSAEKDGDTTSAIWVEKAGSEHWFFCITITATGKDFKKDFDVLKKAALSFSADMSNVPEKPGKTRWVDRIFGFHIELAGFKKDPQPWAEAILDMWSLQEQTNHHGTFFVKLVRPAAKEKFDDLMARVRKVQETNKRKIVSEEAAKRGELSGKRMRIEFEQAGKQHVHDYVFLWDNGIVWQVVATWRPADADGKEADLILAVDKFLPTAGK